MFDWTGQSTCPRASLLILSLVAAGLGCGKGSGAQATDARGATFRDGGYPVECLASCDDHNSCTVDYCDLTTGECHNDVAPDGTTCDDGNLCTLGDSCKAGVCYGATQKDCTTPPDQCHEPGYCDTTDGTCVFALSKDGKQCDDNNLCTSGEYCVNGACTGTSLQCEPPAICGSQDGICKDNGVTAFPSPLWGLFLNNSVTATDFHGFALAPSGSLFLVGTFTGTLDLGAGPMTSAGASDAFIARLDPQGGSALWSKFYGDRYAQGGVAVAVNAAGTVLAAGAFLGTIDLVTAQYTDLASSPLVFVAAHQDTDGTELWAKSIDLCQSCSSIADIQLYAIADPAGDFIICGAADKAVTSFTGGAGGGYDVIVAKLDRLKGDLMWARQIGAAGDDYCDNLAADPSGNIYLVGRYGRGGKLDFGNGVTLPAFTGGTQVPGFVAKLDGQQGSTLWARPIAPKTAGAKLSPKTIATDGHSVWIGGGLTVGAAFDTFTLTALTGVSNDPTAFAAELAAADGSITWAKSWGSNALVNGISLTSAGDLLVAGEYAKGMAFETGTLTDSPNSATRQAFIAKLVPGSGQAKVARGYAAAAAEQSSSQALVIVADLSLSSSPPNANYVTGTFLQKFDLGAPLIPFAGVGSKQVFLAKIAP